MNFRYSGLFKEDDQITMIRIEQRKEQDKISDWLLVSVETALYIVIVITAAALRFARLGHWPLLSEEAAQAWGAWQWLQGTGRDELGYSPLLFSGNLLIFFAFGASDAAARLWPAVFGTLLAIFPYFLRDRLGRFGALFASLLIAVSPTLLYFSRTLDGSIVAAASALALLVAISGYSETRWQGYVYLGAIALAFGLMSDPTFYTFLVAALCFWGYLRLAKPITEESLADNWLYTAWQELKGDKQLLRKAGGLVIGLLVLVGSALFIHIGGWQATLDLFAQWLRLFPNRDGTNWLYFLRVLAVYESLPLLAGLAALLITMRRGDLTSIFLGIWFAVALLLHSLAGTRPPAAVPIILLPLILLSGRAMERLIETIQNVELDPQNWLFLVLAAILISFLYLQLAGFTVMGDRAYLRLAMVSLGMLLLSFAAFWYWMGSRQALPVGAVLILGVLGVLFVHSSIRLNYYTPRDPREFLNRTPTSLDAADIQPFLEDLSGRFAGDQHAMPILVEEGLSPVVSWYIRDFRTVRYAGSVPSEPEERAVIAKARDKLEGPKGFLGQKFKLRESADTSGLGWGDWLKWFFRRFEIGRSVVEEQIEIWVRP